MEVIPNTRGGTKLFLKGIYAQQFGGNASNGNISAARVLK